MNPDQALGQLRMQEAINGNEDLAKVLNVLLKCSNSGHLFGAVGYLVSCYHAARAAGWAWNAFDEGMSAFVNATQTQMSIDLMESLNGTDQELKGRQLSELVSAINLFRLQGAVFTPGEVRRPDPLEVRISSLPARITETTVARDDEYEIVKTTQVEQDVFGAQNV